MSHTNVSSFPIPVAAKQPGGELVGSQMGSGSTSTAELAASLTREASSQTYYTIRYLVDRPLVADAYRSYAYFRWVDDTLDDEIVERAERLSFLARQQEIIDRCRHGERPEGLCPEERLVADLIRNNPAENSGLQIYIDQMMAVMAFDTERKGRLISQKELVDYTRSLATAVTANLHHFIGHDDAAPQDESRNAAVTAAHITHMLRDAIEDAAAGYFNVPAEFLEAKGIGPADVNREGYRAWVNSQVKLARSYFAIGRSYLAQVKSFRCRLAGYAYIARFEVVLDAIEKEDYWLRAAYPERKSNRARLKMILAAIRQTIGTALKRPQAPSAGLLSSTEVIR